MLPLLGYTKEELENIRNAVAEEMMADARDSVQTGRDLNVKDHDGATAVSNRIYHIISNCRIGEGQGEGEIVDLAPVARISVLG